MIEITFEHFVGGLFIVGTLLIIILLFREYLMMGDRLKFIDGEFEDDLNRLIKEKIHRNNDIYFNKRKVR